MSLMLRRGIEALVGAALVVVAMVAVLPAVAEAQSITTTQEAARDADANLAAARVVVVVEPGDSLWSISAERLGADATLGQIDRKVERIYALNSDQIGPDPNLIFVGQKLSLPAAMGRSAGPTHHDAKATISPTTRPAARPAAREGGTSRTAAAAVSPKERSADHATRTEKAPTLASEANQPSRPAPRTPEAALAEAKPEKAPAAAVGETPSLPKEADAAPAVPAVRQAASEEDSPTTSSLLTPLLRSVRSVVTSAALVVGAAITEVRETAVASERRTTLGWVIVVLTVTVGALMAWKLPMKRSTRSDVERWGIPTGYLGGGGSYISHSGEQSPHDESPARVAPVAVGPSRTNGSKDKAQERKRRLTEASKQRSDDDSAEGGR